MFGLFKKNNKAELKKQILIEEAKLEIAKMELESRKDSIKREQSLLDLEQYNNERESNLNIREGSLGDQKILTELNFRIQAKETRLEDLNHRLETRDEKRIVTLETAHAQVLATKDATINQQNDYIKVLITKLGQPATHCNAPIFLGNGSYSKQQLRAAKRMGTELEEEEEE